MRRKPFVLTKVEEYFLAASEDHNVGAQVARAIISRHLARDISVSEMRQVYERLLELGLVEPYRGRHGSRRPVPLKGTRTRDLCFTATREGVLYLKKPRRRT